MPGIIVCDASCFIILEKIGELDLLHKLFGTVTTTSEISTEFGLPLPFWIEIKAPSDKGFQTSIETVVDKGEASAIALAMEHLDSLLVIDELKGRKLASQLGLNLTGTLGLLVDAKSAGHIPLVKPLLARIQQTNFRLSKALEKVILARSGEI